MAIKIQINSLEALERLIGGDNEIELELRQSVVESFAHKHLKALASDGVMKKAEKAISDAVVSEIFIKSKTYPYETYLNEEYRERISKSVKGQFEVSVKTQINELVKVSELMKIIDSRLSIAAEQIENELSSKSLNERLEKMVDARLKSKLGIS